MIAIDKNFLESFHDSFQVFFLMRDVGWYVCTSVSRKKYVKLSHT